MGNVVRMDAGATGRSPVREMPNQVGAGGVCSVTDGYRQEAIGMARALGYHIQSRLATEGLCDAVSDTELTIMALMCETVANRMQHYLQVKGMAARWREPAAEVQ